MVIKCPFCKAENPDDTRVCSKCGKHISTDLIISILQVLRSNQNHGYNLILQGLRSKQNYVNDMIISILQLKSNQNYGDKM
jgi:predicted amidophosphoribosyltransferase